MTKAKAKKVTWIMSVIAPFFSIFIFQKIRMKKRTKLVCFLPKTSWFIDWSKSETHKQLS